MVSGSSSRYSSLQKDARSVVAMEDRSLVRKASDEGASKSTHGEAVKNNFIATSTQGLFLKRDCDRFLYYREVALVTAQNLRNEEPSLFFSIVRRGSE